MDVKDLFGDGTLGADEFMEKLAAAGLVILDGSDGGYVPASRERELTAELENERARHEETVNLVRAKAALVCGLMKHGAHNPSLAASAIGLDGIAGDDGEMAKAVEEKVSSLKASEPYMFGTRADGALSVSTGAAHGGASVDTDTMSDSEYYRYRNVK